MALTEAAKARQRRYAQTDKGRVTRQRAVAKAKAEGRYADYNRRYYATDHGRQVAIINQKLYEQRHPERAKEGPLFSSACSPHGQTCAAALRAMF
jgi:hypothetical protein